MRQFEYDDFDDDFDQTFNKGSKLMLPKLNATQSGMYKNDSRDNLNPWDVA